MERVSNKKKKKRNIQISILPLINSCLLLLWLLRVGAGRLVTTFFPDDGSSPVLCDDRVLKDENNVVVTYHNPLDNVADLAHHFFSRCLVANVVPYVVTKKTVFKWQEGFWCVLK